MTGIQLQEVQIGHPRDRVPTDVTNGRAVNQSRSTENFVVDRIKMEIRSKRIVMKSEK